MLTLDLKKSNDNLVVHGKLILYLSTNVSQPISNPGPSQVNGVTETLSGLSINSSSSAAASSNNLAAGSTLSRTPSAHVETAAAVQAAMPQPHIPPAPVAAAEPDGPARITTVTYDAGSVLKAWDAEVRAMVG